MKFCWIGILKVLYSDNGGSFLDNSDSFSDGNYFVIVLHIPAFILHEGFFFFFFWHLLSYPHLFRHGPVLFLPCSSQR